MSALKIDPRHLPDEGLHLEGTQPSTFFGLAEKDTARAVSPLTYDLDIMRDDDDLIITGTLDATFEIECGRCNERFQQRVELTDYVTEMAIENDLPVDLTECLREDILLALPTYPRCEDGNVQPRECPAEGRFEAAPETVSIEPNEATDKEVWNALDQLQNLKRN